MLPRTPATSLKHPHPTTALATSDPCFGWDQTGLGTFFKKSDWLEHYVAQVLAPLHFCQVLYKCVCLSQILPNLYSTCVRIFLPQDVRAATSQSTLLPPAAHFAKVFRDAAYFFTVCVGGPLAIHISVM